MDVDPSSPAENRPARVTSSCSFRSLRFRFAFRLEKVRGELFAIQMLVEQSLALIASVSSSLGKFHSSSVLNLYCRRWSIAKDIIVKIFHNRAREIDPFPFISIKSTNIYPCRRKLDANRGPIRRFHARD